MDIMLRPEQAGDQEFLFALYASTRVKELELVPWTDSQKKDFLKMQFNAQSTHYHQHYPDAAYQIILSGQQPIGRLSLIADQTRYTSLILLCCQSIAVAA